MSYSYGPTVVLTSFGMGEPFGGSSYEAKENSYGAFAAHAAPSKAPSQGSRQAFANLSNTASNNNAAEGFVVWEDAHCGQAASTQVASTSGRPPLAEQQLNTASASCAAPKRASSGAPAQRSKRNTWTDIDAQNAGNPLACSEYAQVIFDHLATAELLNRPNPAYVTHVQPEMTAGMRCILVDWLVEVGQEYRLCSETLHLCLNLLDRFLSVQPVAREELQLAGIAAMWVAAKFEEIYAPTAANLTFITDSTYDAGQLVDMEARLLAALNWVVSVPTGKTFQRRYLQACAADEQLHYLAAFLLELSLMDEGLLAHLPSQLAAGSVYLARSMLGHRPWDATLAHYTRYTEEDVAPVAADLAWTHARIHADRTYTAMLDKYGSDKLLGVARLRPCEPLAAASELRAAQLAAAAAAEAAAAAGCGTPAAPPAAAGSTGASASGEGCCDCAAWGSGSGSEPCYSPSTAAGLQLQHAAALQHQGEQELVLLPSDFSSDMELI